MRTSLALPHSRRSASSVSHEFVVAATLIPPLLLAGLIDGPRLLSLGPMTMLAGLAVLQVVWAAAVLVRIGAYPRALAMLLLPWAAFVGWMLVRSAPSGLTSSGLQNELVYLLFGLNLLLAGTVSASYPSAASGAIAIGMTGLDLCALGLIATSLLTDWIVGQRAVGLLAVVAASWHLAGWHCERRWAGTRAILWTAAALLSSSRMAIAVIAVNAAMVASWQARMQPIRALRRMPAVIVGGALIVALIASQWALLSERFFEGYTRVDIGGMSVSTSGRSEFWPVVFESAMQHPFVGGGLASSEAALVDFDAAVVGHPHNDYLRLWHDGGLFGLLLALSALLRWLWRLRRQSRQAALTTAPFAHVDLAAFLTLSGVLLSAVTDNGFVYSFVMGPAGILIGAGLGSRLRAGRPQPASPRREFTVRAYGAPLGRAARGHS